MHLRCSALSTRRSVLYTLKTCNSLLTLRVVLSTARYASPSFHSLLHCPSAPTSAHITYSRRLCTMPSKGYQLTPEQIALSGERKRLKLLKQKEKEQTDLDASSTDEDYRGKILSREWIPLPRSTSSPSGSHVVKVMTWNVSARCIMSSASPISHKDRY